MEGIFDSSAGKVEGRITYGGCSDFAATRDPAESPSSRTDNPTAAHKSGQPAQPSSQPKPAAQPNPRTLAQASPSPTQPKIANQAPPRRSAAQAAPAQAGAKVQTGSKAQAGAKPANKTTDADIQKALQKAIDLEAELTNPVLSWKMVTKKDPETGGSSPHPTANTMLSMDGETVDATASCNTNGVSVFFVLDSDESMTAPAFAWYNDDSTSNGDPVVDVRVRVDGRGGHVAKGYPDNDQDKLYSNSMGIFFYDPGLIARAAHARELTSRTGTPLDGLMGPLVKRAAEAEAQEAANSAAGPMSDLLTARSIRVELPIKDDDTEPFLDLNPQDKVLHKFVADCNARFSGGSPPPPAASTPAGSAAAQSPDPSRNGARSSGAPARTK